MFKHVGKLSQTDTRCVVVMMQIPGREDHALIVESDSLPDRWHQPVMEIIESSECQGDTNAANVMGRRLMPDTGKSVLTTLHDAGLLKATPVDRIIMVPTPGAAYPLRSVLEQMGKLAATGEVSMVDNTAVTDAIAENVYETKFNQHAANANAMKRDQAEGLAKGYMLQAEMLMSDASSLFEKAYQVAPWMRPARSAAPASVAPVATAQVAPATSAAVPGTLVVNKDGTVRKPAGRPKKAASAS